MPDASRQDVCRRTAAALRDRRPAGIKAVLGFDGFVDNLMQAVDRRLSADHFEPVRTLDALGRRISAAAGHSSNLELVLKQQKLGGNGTIFANAMAVLGLSVTYVGSLGYPTIHPIFDNFGRVATLHSIANPGVTDALEFDDGKLMLNKNESLADVTWDNLIGRLGLDALRQAFDAADLISMANWTMLPHLSDIWRKVLVDVMPTLSNDRRRHLFIDLADPAKRTDADLTDALNLLTAFQPYCDVVLGLNANEARRVATLLNLGDFPANRARAAAVRDRLGLSAIVVHDRHGAAAVTAHDVDAIQGPFVQRPKVTTGAGDHFNSGYAFALALGLKLDECLCCGVAVGGYYVSRAA
ncbi:MAG TPA: carbohydrate kinase family protein, partial [Tepidisphaeraceae bacterium]